MAGNGALEKMGAKQSGSQFYTASAPCIKRMWSTELEKNPEPEKMKRMKTSMAVLKIGARRTSMLLSTALAPLGWPRMMWIVSPG